GFFQNPDQSLYSVVLMTSWGWIGFNAIVYLAALQSIPQELVEAASIDGAGRFTTFRRIVWPLLGPATLFLVVWASINALQVFDEIYVSTRGGPLHSTTVVVYYLFQQAFQFFAAGSAAASSTPFSSPARPSSASSSCAAWRATRSRGCASSGATCCSSCCWRR